MQLSLHNVDPEALVGLAKRQVCGGLASFSRADRLRFVSRVAPDEHSGCWLWTGSRLGRHYGQFVVQVAPGKQQHLYAHRAAWALSHGPIPNGLYVCHSCDVPLCVNPDHLFLGTQFDNMRDASRKGRLRGPRRRKAA